MFKELLTMAKQIWAYFTAVTGSSATEYQISDTGEKKILKTEDVKDQALALWKTGIYSLVSMTFLAAPLRTWVLGLLVTCDCPCFTQNFFVCVIQKCSFDIFISFKTLKVITAYDWEWKIFFLALLCVWNNRFENTLQNLYTVGV